MRTAYIDSEGYQWCLRNKEVVPCSLEQALRKIHNEWVFLKLKQQLKAAR